ncbi:MAG: hypothetical protein DSZ24_03275, partial [Thermodesulfatator sp.]
CLRPVATPKDIRRLCEESRKYGMAGVCVPPIYVSLARDLLAGSSVRVVTVVGFPLGFEPREIKAAQAQRYRDLGAQELDMVLNLALVKSGNLAEALSEVEEVVRAAEPSPLKVILECGYLSQEEKRELASRLPETGAAYLKTATGFGPQGATVEDVRLLAEAVRGRMKIKAAGGIRTLTQALELLEAGASRLGTSAGAQIVREYLQEKAPPEVEIFVDGACLGNPGPGGFAALLRTQGQKRIITGGEAFTTNNRMELRAAIEALKLLKRPCRVRIYTDSRYLLSGATEWLPRWEKRGFRTSGGKPVKNQDLWEELARLLRVHEVEWTWVEGHAGCPENEECDRLARQEARRRR